MQRQQPPAQQRQPQDPNGSRTSSSTFSATSFTSSVTTSSSSSTPLSSSVSFQDIPAAKVKTGSSLIRRPNSFPLVAEALSPPIIAASNAIAPPDININISIDDHDDDIQMAPSCNKFPHTHTQATAAATSAPSTQLQSLPSHDRDAPRNTPITALSSQSNNPSAPSHDTQTNSNTNRDRDSTHTFQSTQLQQHHQHTASAFQPPKHPNAPTSMIPKSTSGSAGNYTLRQSRSDAIHTNLSGRTEQQYQQQLLHDNDTDRSSRSSSNFILSLSLSQSRSGTIDSLDEALRSDQFSSSHRSGSESSLPPPIPTSISSSSSTLSSAPSPSPPQPPAPFNLGAVTAAQLGTFLTVFESLNVAAQPENEALITVRRLLDVLDFLTDKMALPVCERLYTALSSTTCIRALISLLSDTTVRAKRRVTYEVLKEFRYPYVVATILSSPKIADAILCVPELLDDLLSILERRQCHPIVAAHTVNLLVTYLEYNPAPLLNVLENDNRRVSALKHIATHLHHASVVDLVVALLPSNGANGHFLPSAEHGLYPKKGLSFLANNYCLHVFSDTFREAAEKAADAHAVGSMVASAHQNNQMQQHVSQMYHEDQPEEPVEEESVRRAVYNAELKANNAIAAYLAVIEHTVRKVRVDRNSPECIYLNVYSTPSTAKTVGNILDTGVKSYKRSNGQCADFLIAAITCTTKILEIVEKDATKRVASTAGQPPKIQLGVLAYEIRDRLSALIMLATEKGVGLSKTAARIRMYTLQLLGTVQRVCGAYDEEKISGSEEKRNAKDIFGLLDKLRFGEVAMKMIVLHAGHSMLHTCVLKSVETALLADSSNEYSRKHWLKRSKLTWNIMKMWKKEHVSSNGNSDATAMGMKLHRNRAELSSALVHLACIVHHWIACTHAKCKPGEIAEARNILGEEGINAFNDFFEGTIKQRIEKEKGGIEKPTRPRVGQRSLGMLQASPPSTSGFVSWVGGISNGSKNGVHLVRSPSAHRFGYTEPNATKRPRNRFAELFDRADEDGDDFGINRDDTFARIRAAAEARLHNGSGNGNSSGANGGGIGALRRSCGFEDGDGDEEMKDELFD